MSGDNFIILNTNTFVVKYGQGDNVTQRFKYDKLRDALIKVKQLQDEYDPEYGVTLES